MLISAAVRRLRSCRQAPDGILSVLVSPLFLKLCVRSPSTVNTYNAEDVMIRGNRIADTSFTAIWLVTHIYTVARVTIKDNTITRVGRTAPTYYAISVDHIPPRGLPAGAPWPGTVGDITIEGNVVRDSPNGIAFSNVGGTNLIRANRVENSSTAGKCQSGYSIRPLASSKTVFCDNVGVNCARYFVAPDVASRANDLR